MEEDTLLTIYVDGSSKPKPRRGGVGLIFSWVDEEGNEVTSEDALPFSYEGGSNNQMEIEAVIEALKIATGRHAPVDPVRFEKILVSTDSKHVSGHFRTALSTWPARGWMTNEGSPVLNTLQWKELRRIVNRLWRERRLRVDVEWKPGKKGAQAKRVDKLAKKSADSPLRRKLEHQRVRPKWGPQTVEKGCVKVHGQEEVVRLVTDRLVRPHNVYRYMYEVVDRASPDYQKVDYVFSHILLNAGHIYRVRFNADMGYPQIEEMLEEFPLDSFTKSDYGSSSRAPWEDGPGQSDPSL